MSTIPDLFHGMKPYAIFHYYTTLVNMEDHQKSWYRLVVTLVHVHGLHKSRPKQCRVKYTSIYVDYNSRKLTNNISDITC